MRAESDVTRSSVLVRTSCETWSGTYPSMAEWASLQIVAQNVLQEGDDFAVRADLPDPGGFAYGELHGAYCEEDDPCAFLFRWTRHAGGAFVAVGYSIGITVQKRCETVA